MHYGSHLRQLVGLRYVTSGVPFWFIIPLLPILPIRWLYIRRRMLGVNEKVSVPADMISRGMSAVFALNAGRRSQHSTSWHETSRQISSPYSDDSVADPLRLLHWIVPVTLFVEDSVNYVDSSGTEYLFGTVPQGLTVRSGSNIETYFHITDWRKTAGHSHRCEPNKKILNRPVQSGM